MSFTSRFKENAAPVGNGLLFAVALTTPVVLGVAFQAFSLVSAASFGAMFALLIAPRHGALARVVGISTGGLLVVLAAALGIALQGRHDLVLVRFFRHPAHGPGFSRRHCAGHLPQPGEHAL